MQGNCENYCRPESSRKHGYQVINSHLYLNYLFNKSIANDSAFIDFKHIIASSGKYVC